MDLELNSASPPLRVSSLLSGPLRDGHTRRCVRGPRTQLIEATPFSEVVRHDPCFDISRGRPVSLIVREGRGLKGPPVRPASAWKPDTDGCGRPRRLLSSARARPRRRPGRAGRAAPGCAQRPTRQRVRKPCSALWAAIRRAGLTASSLPSPRGRPSAAHHIPSPARRLSRTLVLRRSGAARLGGARFDAQHVDVDQARLVSVEL